MCKSFVQDLIFGYSENTFLGVPRWVGLFAASPHKAAFHCALLRAFRFNPSRKRHNILNTTLVSFNEGVSLLTHSLGLYLSIKKSSVMRIKRNRDLFIVGCLKVSIQ